MAGKLPNQWRSNFLTGNIMKLSRKAYITLNKAIILTISLFSLPAHAEIISYKTPKTQCNLKILNDGKEQEDIVGCYNRRNTDTEEFIRKILGDNKFKTLLDWKNKNFSNAPFDNSFYVIDDNRIIVSIITAPIVGGLYAVDISSSTDKVTSTRISYGGCYMEKILKDKSNTEHMVLKCGVLSHGVSSEYAEILNSEHLQSVDRERSDIVRLFDGSQNSGDGERSGCNGHHEDFTAKKALLGAAITYEDINKDSYDDIIVTAHKQNCKTKRKHSNIKKYYASKYGFVLQH